MHVYSPGLWAKSVLNLVVTKKIFVSLRNTSHLSSHPHPWQIPWGMLCICGWHETSAFLQGHRLLQQQGLQSPLVSIKQVPVITLKTLDAPITSCNLLKSTMGAVAWVIVVKCLLSNGCLPPLHFLQCGKIDLVHVHCHLGTHMLSWRLDCIWLNARNHCPLLWISIACSQKNPFLCSSIVESLKQISLALARTCPGVWDMMVNGGSKRCKQIFLLIWTRNFSWTSYFSGCRISSKFLWCCQRMGHIHAKVQSYQPCLMSKGK